MFTHDDATINNDVPTASSTIMCLDDVIAQLTAARDALLASPDAIASARLWDKIDNAGYAATSIRSNALDADEDHA